MSWADRWKAKTKDFSPEKSENAVLSIGVWGYLVVGLVCIAVWIGKGNLTPEVVRNQASILAGTGAAVLAMSAK